MKLKQITGWLDRELEIDKFDDVSNNGLQVARSGEDIATVAFAVDGSAASVKAAVEAGAQLLVVHHGISWGGGIRRVTGGAYNVLAAAIGGNLALYGVHLPLDASRKYGNNWEIARLLALTHVRPAFSYHGNVIGVVGTASRSVSLRLGLREVEFGKGCRVGVCSGGAGGFAEEAKALGCDLFVTGEADWGETVAAGNAGASLVCCGHYETETFGVRALARAMSRALKVKTVLVEPGKGVCACQCGRAPTRGRA